MGSFGRQVIHRWKNIKFVQNGPSVLAGIYETVHDSILIFTKKNEPMYNYIFNP